MRVTEQIDAMETLATNPIKYLVVPRFLALIIMLPLLTVYSDLVGKGLPLFTEKGSIIRRELENFIVAEEIKRGYKHVYTPELAKVDLY